MNTELYSQLIIDPGKDTTVCQDETLILGGTPVVSGGSGNYSYHWRPEEGLNDPSLSKPVLITQASGIYTVRVTDSVLLITDSASVNVTVIPSPVVNAGGDQTVCIEGNIVNISVSGIITGTTSTGVWSTSGDGYFPPGNTLLNTSYTLGENDKKVLNFGIYLTSTNNGICSPVSDTVIIYVLEATHVFAGDDITVCDNNFSVPLNGEVYGGTVTGIWSSRGAGEFLPSASGLTTNYILSDSDTSNNELYLILTSTQNRGCKAISDSLKLNFTRSPALFAGPDTSVSNRIIDLNGSIYPDLKVKWTTTGNGYFFPSDSVLKTRYYSTIDEILTGAEILFKLSITENIECGLLSDSVTIKNNRNETPNAFSPDNDGVNDIFMKGENLKVYNRWGQLIFEGPDGWDGKYKGELISTGTYFYLIEYQDSAGETKTTRGTVTLMVNK